MFASNFISAVQCRRPDQGAKQMDGDCASNTSELTQGAAGGSLTVPSDWTDQTIGRLIVIDSLGIGTEGNGVR